MIVSGKLGHGNRFKTCILHHLGDPAFRGRVQMGVVAVVELTAHRHEIGKQHGENSVVLKYAACLGKKLERRTAIRQVLDEMRGINQVEDTCIARDWRHQARRHFQTVSAKAVALAFVGLDTCVHQAARARFRREISFSDTELNYRFAIKVRFDQADHYLILLGDQPAGQIVLVGREIVVVVGQTSPLRVCIRLFNAFFYVPVPVDALF